MSKKWRSLCAFILSLGLFSNAFAVDVALTFDRDTDGFTTNEDVAGAVVEWSDFNGGSMAITAPGGWAGNAAQLQIHDFPDLFGHLQEMLDFGGTISYDVFIEPSVISATGNPGWFETVHIGNSPAMWDQWVVNYGIGAGSWPLDQSSATTVRTNVEFAEARTEGDNIVQYDLVDGWAQFYLGLNNQGSSPDNQDNFVDSATIYFDNVTFSTCDPVDAQPDPTPGSWSIRRWNADSELGSLTDAMAAMDSLDLQDTCSVHDATSEVINFADPQNAGGGYSSPLAKTPFPNDAGGDDEDFVVRAVANVEIPSSGQYTFGFDGDDGMRLRIDGAEFSLQNGGANSIAAGDVMESPNTTGDAFTLASTFLEAGTHEVEVVYFERAGGAFAEVFAAEGVKDTLDSSFGLIGQQQGVAIAQGPIPTMAGQFQTTAYIECGENMPNDLEQAQACIVSSDPFDQFPAEVSTINFNDPDGGDAGYIGGDVAFPNSFPEEPSDNFALDYSGRVIIPEDGVYTFGFRGDDGSTLSLDGADFTILNEGGPRSVSDDGETIAFNGLTGNSETYASTFMAAGEYDISGIWWENGGGANLEIFVAPGEVGEFNGAVFRLLGSPAETIDVSAPAGLSIGAVATTCGDFDMDGDIDAADRTIQTVGWTGALQEGGTATFADGDCDGDGDVDTADQTGLIGNWTGALMAGNLTDGDDADLVYDPATGNVTLDASDTAAGQLISFVIGTDQNNMNTEATQVPFIDAGTNTDNTPFQIGQTDPLNQGAGPLVDIGNVLPTGMDLVALSEYLTIAEYASELGVGGTLDLRVVPEPSGLALALFGLLGLTMWRRRQ